MQATAPTDQSVSTTGPADKSVSTAGANESVVTIAPTDQSGTAPATTDQPVSTITASQSVASTAPTNQTVPASAPAHQSVPTDAATTAAGVSSDRNMWDDARRIFTETVGSDDTSSQGTGVTTPSQPIIDRILQNSNCGSDTTTTTRPVSPTRSSTLTADSEGIGIQANGDTSQVTDSNQRSPERQASPTGWQNITIKPESPENIPSLDQNGSSQVQPDPENPVTIATGDQQDLPHTEDGAVSSTADVSLDRQDKPENATTVPDKDRNLDHSQSDQTDFIAVVGNAGGGDLDKAAADKPESESVVSSASSPVVVSEASDPDSDDIVVVESYSIRTTDDIAPVTLLVASDAEEISDSDVPTSNATAARRNARKKHLAKTTNRRRVNVLNIQKPNDEVEYFDGSCCSGSDNEASRINDCESDDEHIIRPPALDVPRLLVDPESGDMTPDSERTQQPSISLNPVDLPGCNVDGPASGREVSMDTSEVRPPGQGVIEVGPVVPVSVVGTTVPGSAAMEDSGQTTHTGRPPSTSPLDSRDILTALCAVDPQGTADTIVPHQLPPEPLSVTMTKDVPCLSGPPATMSSAEIQPPRGVSPPYSNIVRPPLTTPGSVSAQQTPGITPLQRPQTFREIGNRFMSGMSTHVPTGSEMYDPRIYIPSTRTTMPPMPLETPVMAPQRTSFPPHGPPNVTRDPFARGMPPPVLGSGPHMMPGRGPVDPRLQQLHPNHQPPFQVGPTVSSQILQVPSFEPRAQPLGPRNPARVPHPGLGQLTGLHVARPPQVPTPPQVPPNPSSSMAAVGRSHSIHLVHRRRPSAERSPALAINSQGNTAPAPHAMDTVAPHVIQPLPQPQCDPVPGSDMITLVPDLDDPLPVPVSLAEGLGEDIQPLPRRWGRLAYHQF